VKNVINTQIYTFTVQNSTDILQKQYYKSSVNTQTIHLHSTVSVYVAVSLRLLYILPLHSEGLSH